MIRLGDFLNRVFSLSTGERKPVWVYEWENKFYPDVVNSANLLCVFKSDYIPCMTLKQEICDSIVKEIYWTVEGIVVAVEWTAK